MDEYQLQLSMLLLFQDQNMKSMPLPVNQIVQTVELILSDWHRPA